MWPVPVRREAHKGHTIFRKTNVQNFKVFPPLIGLLSLGLCRWGRNYNAPSADGFVTLLCICSITILSKALFRTNVSFKSFTIGKFFFIQPSRMLKWNVLYLTFSEEQHYRECYWEVLSLAKNFLYSFRLRNKYFPYSCKKISLQEATFWCRIFPKLGCWRWELMASFINKVNLRLKH